MLTLEGQKINYGYDTDQKRVLIHGQNFTVLDRNQNHGLPRLTLESASPQESTVPTDKAGSPELPPQPL